MNPYTKTLLSNSNIKISETLAEIFNVNLTEWNIKNTTSISSFLKIKYAAIEVGERKNGTCECCGANSGHYVFKNKVKVFEILNETGYFEIKFENTEERLLLGEILKTVRLKLQHNKFLCIMCGSPKLNNPPPHRN